jgi:hypothetical protein
MGAVDHVYRSQEGDGLSGGLQQLLVAALGGARLAENFSTAHCSLVRADHDTGGMQPRDGFSLEPGEADRHLLGRFARHSLLVDRWRDALERQLQALEQDTSVGRGGGQEKQGFKLEFVLTRGRAVPIIRGPCRAPRPI